MSLAMLSETANGEFPVRLRRVGNRCEVLLADKDQAMRLRRQLVKHGICCTFPTPTWRRTEHSFFVPLAGETTLERLRGRIGNVGGVEIMTDAPEWAT